jgi:hypothetical protein
VGVTDRAAPGQSMQGVTSRTANFVTRTIYVTAMHASCSRAIAERAWHPPACGTLTACCVRVTWAAVRCVPLHVCLTAEYSRTQQQRGGGGGGSGSSSISKRRGSIRSVPAQQTSIISKRRGRRASQPKKPGAATIGHWSNAKVKASTITGQ